MLRVTPPMSRKACPRQVKYFKRRTERKESTALLLSDLRRRENSTHNCRIHAPEIQCERDTWSNMSAFAFLQPRVVLQRRIEADTITYAREFFWFWGEGQCVLWHSFSRILFNFVSGITEDQTLMPWPSSKFPCPHPKCPTLYFKFQNRVLTLNKKCFLRN